jgi:AraC-like DNA-binding protein
MLYKLNILILFLGAIQGVLISLFFFRKKEKDASQIYFSLFLTVIGLQLTFKAVAKSWLWYNVQLIYLLSYSLPYLIGPLLYLFFRSRHRGSSFSKIDILHFLPFAWHITNTLTTELFAINLIPSFYWSIVPWPAPDLLLLFAYSYASWRLLDRDERNDIQQSLKNFLLWVISIETIIIITITLMVRRIDTFPDIRMVFVLLTILIYWISYKLISQPELFISKMSSGSSVALNIQRKLKYEHSGLKDEAAAQIATRLHDAIHKQRIFLEPEISIDDVAKKIDVAKHHLSRVINERFGKTYIELANGWRLEEARLKLKDPKFKHYTILAIALESGFTSVSSFNTMFKRHFQVTPSAFRANNRNEMSA